MTGLLYKAWALTKDRSVAAYKELADRLQVLNTLRLLHGAIGICGEAGELMDAVKKHIMYGKELDKNNIKEELGDLCWYMSLVMESVGTNWEEVMKMNHDKLEKRYPSGFTEKAAQERADKVVPKLPRKLKGPKASVSVSGFPCNKIEAIKLIREYSGTSLRDAHSMVMNETKQTIFRGKTVKCYDLADSLIELGVQARVVAK